MYGNFTVRYFRIRILWCEVREYPFNSDELAKAIQSGPSTKNTVTSSLNDWYLKPNKI